MKNSKYLKLSVAALCLTMALGVSGCAKSTKPEVGYKSQGIADPIEPFNRVMFKFNDIVDRVLFEPIAKGYNFVLPQFARNSIQSFMRNVNTPLTLANNLLQGQVGDAGVTAARFVINTTAGIGGLVDVAKAQGLEYKDEDFGQTLASWGVGNGFYLVLPFMGPSSLRDTVGMVADTAADPVRIVSNNTDNDWIYYTKTGIEAVDGRSRLIAAVDDLRRNSLDYYAAAKSAYVQNRDASIRNEKAGSVNAAPSYEEMQ